MAFACRDVSPEQVADVPGGTFERGDRVVVEQAAASFYVGRVLEKVGGDLKIQTESGGDPKKVTASDVYRLPAPTWVPTAPTYAICLDRDSWVACRVSRVDESRVEATSPEGRSMELRPAELLQPTALTRLNIEKNFERVASRSAFSMGFSTAPTPRPPPRWRPAPRERVVVSTGRGWYTAKVVEYGDGQMRITTEAEKRGIWIANDRIIPDPPYKTAPRRGEYALARPAAPSQPWKAVLIDRVTVTDFATVDADGNRERMGAQSLVPLSVPAAP